MGMEDDMGFKVSDFGPKARQQLLVNDAIQNGKQLNRAGVRPVEASSKERNKVQPLDGGGKMRKQSSGDVAVIVSLIACREREIDDDSNVYSLVPLRDAIADSLGLNDADKRIHFKYAQVVSRASVGVIVKIEKL